MSVSSTSLTHATPAFRTFCGERALAALPRELDRLGCHRPVIVTGPWFASFPDAEARVINAVGSRLAGVFSQVEEHSPIPSVEALVALLSDVNADALIAVGGGSSIVTARAASILLAEEGSAHDLSTQRDEAGTLRSPRLLEPKIPNWVVPTTPITAYAKAGSAVRDPATGDRLALFDPKTRAQGIFADPVLAMTATPALVTAAALNGFSMAVECLQGGNDDPLADALLLHSLKELTTWLPRAIATPDDPAPRLRLMLATLLAGQGSDYAGGGLAQALSHAAGPRSTTANGVIEALLLPFAMRFTSSAAPGRLEPVRVILSTKAGTGDGGAIVAVKDFTSSIGVPTRLRDVGIRSDDLAQIVSHAMDDWSITRVPKPPTSDEVLALLTEAW